MQELNSLANILQRFLGESKNGISDNGQIQFDCPACADDNGLEHGDGKYNLEVNLVRGKYRCWACENINNMSGKLSSLIKKYGGESLVYEFRDEVKNIKKSKEYEFNAAENNLTFEEDVDLEVKFPEKTYDFLFDGNEKEHEPLEYLKSRGLNESIISKHRLKYTDAFCTNRNFKNRIIIPSYDKYNSLSYYTGRDYSKKSFRKYFNVENLNRREIVFNEWLINWDADIVIVEGPADHLVVPNSIPLMGKSLSSDFYLFDCLINKSTQKIIIFLDDDATLDAIEICKRLSNIDTCGRLYIVPTKKILNNLNYNDNLQLKKLDPSELFRIKKHKGISSALKQMEEYVCIY